MSSESAKQIEEFLWHEKRQRKTETEGDKETENKGGGRGPEDV